MTREEINARLKEIGRLEFIINMADRLEAQDYDELRQLSNEKIKLLKALED